MVKKSHALFVWVLVIYEVIIYLSMDAYVPAMPDIQRAMGVNASLVQLTATVWMVGAFVMQFILGPLSDRWGRRPILLWGGALYVVSSVGCAVSPSIHVLLFCRMLQGIAMPSMYIAGYAAVNELFGTEQAVHKLALMNSITILSPAFGPILGGAFVLFAPWRWIFLILGMVAVIAVVWLAFIMPETVSEEYKARHKLCIKKIVGRYAQVVLNKRFMCMALVTFLPIIGMISWLLAGSFVTVNVFHRSTLAFGIMQGFVFGSYMLGTTVVKKISHAGNHQKLIESGLVIVLIASILAVIISYFWANGLIGFMIALMLVCFGSGLFMPILSRLTLEQSDAPMGVKVTVFSVVRIGSGVLGAIAVPLFYAQNLLSIALIILAFTAITGLLYALQVRQQLQV